MPVKKTILFSQLKSKIDKGIVDGLLKGAEMLTTNIQKETPVDTGTLKSGTVPEGEVVFSGKQAKTKVINDTIYAGAVEFGRQDQPNRKPVGMFRKGGEASKKTILDILNNSLPK